ncbi:MAG: LysR family transcriptional regulator [Myxococcaceae bacterium]
MLNLNLLEVFEAVVRTRSYSQAAKELGIPKSSASRAISKLESDLGVQLVFRTTRQVSPSPAGLSLYDRLAPLLDSMEGALKDIPEREVLPSGTLRVTAPVDLGVVFLAEAVTRYTARYPQVKVELHLTGRVVDLVKERFDIAIRVASRLTDSTLKVRKVASVPVQLYASPVYLARKGTPRTEAELAGHDWVDFRPGPERLKVKGALSAQADARIVCDDLFFLRTALLSGAGLGYLPELLALADIGGGHLVRVLPKHERTGGYLHLVTPANRLVPRKVTAFQDLVVELFQSRALPPG